jgi:hypothetical protein
MVTEARVFIDMPMLRSDEHLQALKHIWNERLCSQYGNRVLASTFTSATSVQSRMKQPKEVFQSAAGYKSHVAALPERRTIHLLNPISVQGQPVFADSVRDEAGHDGGIIFLEMSAVNGVVRGYLEVTRLVSGEKLGSLGRYSRNALRRAGSLRAQSTRHSRKGTEARAFLRATTQTVP